MVADIDITVAGHLCVDMIPALGKVSLEQLMQPGKLLEVGSLTLATGGAVANTGLALHRLGVSVALVAAIGDDRLGRVIMDLLDSERAGLSDHIRVLRGHDSSYTVVLSPRNTDRIFLHNPGANVVFDASSIDETVAQRSRIVHIGYPPILPGLYADDGSELVKLLRQLKDREVITSVDMSLPDRLSAAGRVQWRYVLERALPYIDIFVPSFEEIVFMLRPDDYARASMVEHLLSRPYVEGLTEEMLSLGAAVAGIKCGSQGLFLRTGRQQVVDRLRHRLILSADWDDACVMHPAFDVSVIGTTGAGDSAYAGLLTAMVRGMSADAAVRLSCAVGACNVEAADATSGVRSLEATLSRIANGWPVRDSVLA